MRVHVPLSLLVLASVLGISATTARAQTAPAALERELAEAVIPSPPAQSPAGHDAPADPVEESADLTITAYGHVASGRVFQDQAFTLTDRSVFEGGITVCTKEALCADFWQAASLSGRTQDRETDAVVWKTFQAGERTTLQAKGGKYWLPGRNVWAAKATLTHALGERCSVIASAEFMRKGFVDNVAHAELACATPIAEKVTLDGNVGPSYSDWSGSASLGYEAGLSYQVTDTTSLRGFIKAYSGKDGTDAVFGLGFSSTFAVR